MKKAISAFFRFFAKHWLAVFLLVAWIAGSLYSRQWFHENPDERIEIIRNWIFGTGALGAFYGLVLAVKRQSTFSKQIDTVQKQFSSDALSRGIILLAHENVTMRRSGIRALQDLAETSPEYARQIFNILMDYVEEKCGMEFKEDGAPVQPNKMRKEKTDIELAIAVFLKLQKEKFFAYDKFFFTYLDLRDLRFNNLDFSGVNFYSTCMQNASFHNCKLYKANLAFAKLKGTSFFGTTMHGADISHADFEGDDMHIRPTINETIFYAPGPPINLSKDINKSYLTRAFTIEQGEKMEDGVYKCFVDGTGAEWQGQNVDEWVEKEIAEAEAKLKARENP